MTPKEVLAAVATGEISTIDVERAKDIGAAQYDPKLEAGFLGFRDGTILKVEAYRFEYLVALANIMNPTRPVMNVDAEIESVAKTLKLIRDMGSSL